jgi:hypothetical protein
VQQLAYRRVRHLVCPAVYDQKRQRHLHVPNIHNSFNKNSMMSSVYSLGLLITSHTSCFQWASLRVLHNWFGIWCCLQTLKTKYKV